MISITFQFTDIAAAAQALARMTSPEQFATAIAPTNTPVPTTIAHIDRPDVGAGSQPPAAPVLQQPALPDPAAAAFGGAVAQAAPLVTPAAPTAQPASMQPSAATGPTVAPAVERDSTGLVWDARIHASTKTKTKEGVWTAKRNVDEAFRAQVVADLRGVPVAQSQPVANPLAAMPAPSTGAALPPVAPVAPQAPAAAKTFPEYMAEIGAVFSTRPLDAHNHMAAALATVKLQHVGQLAGNPELIPAVDAEFRRLLG